MDCLVHRLNRLKGENRRLRSNLLKAETKIIWLELRNSTNEDKIADIEWSMVEHHQVYPFVPCVMIDLTQGGDGDVYV